ncbi:MAG: hypothetical protein DRI90_14390 [Deltaproteobacteria bacterium]|nr:MAG: hypothetical protein DRI90_14390 [Deltaproteobacteria bacterium]
MTISRPSTDELVARAADVPLQAQTQVVVDQGDCCVVAVDGQVLGNVEPGRWMLQQLPFGQQLLAGQGGKPDFLYVFTRPFGPLRLGGRLDAAGGARFFAEASVVVHDPVLYVRSVVGSSAEEGSRWIIATLGSELGSAIERVALDTPIEQLSSSLPGITQTVAQGAGPKLGGVGITFQQLTSLNVKSPQGAGPAASGSTGAGAGRLQLVGPIASKVTAPSPGPEITQYETLGLFVAADPVAMGHYSGYQPGWRWLSRGAGSLMNQVHGWPLAPNGTTSHHFATEAEARAYYGALRQHALSSVPGLTPQDTRQEIGLNVPTAYCETLWSNGQEVLYLLYDRMGDMGVFGNETDGAIGIFSAGPEVPAVPDLPIITYRTASDVLYLAVGPGPSGAADHVLIIFSDAHAPEPTIPDGMPRAEWMSKFERPGLQFTGDILVVQWGRFSGAEVLAGEDANDPVASLAAKLGSNIAIPLHVQDEAAARLGGHPPAYAVRMEPGTYSLDHYELTTQNHGNFSFCAISRDGAESFLPSDVVGNAGGVQLGGLSVEQYAMLSTERDNLVMRMGPQACTSREMEALCQRYNIPFTEDGMAGRVNDWEHYIANDPAFSAQWAMQRGIATMRLQGQEPNEQQRAAIAQQQNMAQQSLEQNASQLDASRDAAIHIIRSSANRTPEDVLAMVGQLGPQFAVETVLHKTLRILREPDEFGRFDHIESCVEPLARAHYRSMSPEDQSFEGSEDKFFKEEREAVYGAYDIDVPGFFSRLFG